VSLIEAAAIATFLWAMWWLALRSVVLRIARRTTRAPRRGATLSVPDTVPAEWVEAYRTENDC